VQKISKGADVVKFLTPEWYQQLSSTNSVLVERVRGGEALPDGFVLAAREQTAGRGRYSRVWAARPGRDLTFSFLLRGRLVFPQIVSLPLATALGVAGALEELGIEVQTKWPNDLLIKRKKICGILAESCAEDALVVGVGLNINMSRGQAECIGQPATSVAIETGEEYVVEEALGFLLPHIGTWIGRWQQEGFAALKEAWTQRCFNMGEYVQVGEGKGRKTGVLLGFGEAGQLLLREDDGQQTEVWVGDVAF
jgi:BirA family biotin operon repressor/biotin-[acetyl-CoA-carboxylase] ligase